MKVKQQRISGTNHYIAMVYLTESDKKNIQKMHSKCNVYSQFGSADDTPEVRKILEEFKKDCEQE